MFTPRFVDTMTQAVTQDAPFIITTTVNNSERELYYDKAFASQEEAVITCREIIRSVKSIGFIEIDVTGHDSYIEYIFAPYTGESQFRIFNEYNSNMAEMYEEEARNSYRLSERSYEEIEIWRDEDDDMPF